MSTLGNRPAHFPLYPTPEPAARVLPVLQPVRPRDQAARPIYVVWELTLGCDLACRHCGSRAGPRRPDELTTAEALDLVEQLSRMGTREVTLIGGEAYLRADWSTIASAITARGMVCTMTTGGRGLTLERARQARAAGMTSVSVSVDGLEATHDNLRNVKGSFQSALAAMRHLQEAGVPATCNTQVNRQSLGELDALCTLLLDAGMKAWQLALTVPMGRAADEEQLLLEPYHLLELMPLLAELHRRCAARGVGLQPGNNIGYFGPHEARLRSHLPGAHTGSCGAGLGTLGIEANGAIKGCPSLPSASYVGGNVRDASLQDLWERTTPLRYTRDRTVDDLWGFCRGCYYAEACMAGCTWTSHVVFGRPGNNPYCHHRALELLAQGKRERLVRRALGSGQPFDHGRFEVIVEPWPENELQRIQELVKSAERRESEVSP